MTEEHAIQNKIRIAIAPYCDIFRINVGAGFTKDGRYFNTGVPPGFSDLFGVRKADGRAVFEGKCEDVCTYRLDSAFGKAVVSTNSKGCISKISVDGEDYEMVLSNVKDANG